MLNFKEEIKNETDLKDYFEKEKYSNKEYLTELQNFLDRLDNIKDENLKLELIGKVHRLESIVCKIAVNILKEKF